MSSSVASSNSGSNSSRAQNAVPAPTSFEIDASSLRQPNSARPRHLEARMKLRSGRALSAKQQQRQQREPTSGGSGSAAVPPMLNARKQRLGAHNRGIDAKLRHHQAQQSASTASMQRSITEQQQQASNKRLQRLRERQNRSGSVVAKAKNVAQAHREKFAADVARRREQLEERLWSSELRRRILSRVPRSQLLQHTSAAVEIELRAVNGAARRLQRWWRRLRVAPLAKQFRQLVAGTQILSRFTSTAAAAAAADKDATVTATANYSFDRLVGTVQSPAVIRVTGKLLAAAKRASPDARQRHYNNPSKVLLSAYVIVHYTSQIMPDNGDDEQTIKLLAENAIEQFELWLQHGDAHLGSFVSAWHEFHTEFELWKARDTDKLLQSMADNFAELERLRDSVRSNVDYETEWRPRIDEQQRRIHERMLRIGGTAAVQKHPAVASKFAAVSESAAQRAEEITEVLTAQPSPEHHSVLDSTYIKDDYQVDHQQAASASSAEFGHIFSNEKLAHEIILDPDFELRPSHQPASFEGQVLAMARKAFFDKIRDDVQKNEYSWLPDMVEDIRKQFGAMLEPSGQVMHEINEVLDAQHYRQQVQNHVTVNIKSLLHFIIQKMLQLCAPIRDAAIRELVTEESALTDPVRILEGIMRLLEDMKLDLMNYRLRSIRPVLMKHAAEYEREHFSAALKAGSVRLTLTEQWLHTAGADAVAAANARNPEGIDIPENRIRFDAVYFDALLSLIFGTDAVTAGTCPETLLMDAERLEGFQNEQQAITVVASLTMLTCNMVPEMRNAATVAKLKKNLLVLLQSSQTTVAGLAAHISSSAREVLVPAGKDLSAEQTGLIHSMVDKTLSYKDKVFSLLNRRLLAAVRSQLTTGKLRRDPKSGLDPVHDEVEALSHKIFLLAKHNRAVHAPWYDQIIRKALS